MRISLLFLLIIYGNCRAEAPPIPPSGQAEVVINEIFADPTPAIGLPAAEYVELHNNSGHSINLLGWQLADGTTRTFLPAVTIDAQGYALLCAKGDGSLFSGFGTVVGLSPWPTLNNSGETIVLRDASGQLVDQVNYSDNWYSDAVKKQGGWSLERTVSLPSCSGAGSWKASVGVLGGTPGRLNSVNEDPALWPPLAVTSLELADSTTFRLRFNREVDSALAADPQRYGFNNGLGRPVGVKAESAWTSVVDIQFSHPVKTGMRYELTVTGLADCAANFLASGRGTVYIDVPDAVKPGFPCINEVLFNPRPGGVDFVEIFNPGDAAIDLKGLSLATVDTRDSVIQLKAISAAQLVLEGRAFLVLTTDPVTIRNEYRVPDERRLWTMPAMPSYNNDKGSVVLMKGNTLVDRFDYRETMHFPLIKNREGVSLERVNTARPTQAPGNFRSAASTAGFATPGYKNSQADDDDGSGGGVRLRSKTFSPDNDGFEDEVELIYQFPEQPKVALAMIFRADGVPVIRLVSGATLESSGRITWNGLNDRNERQPVGAYVFYLEVFDLNGKVTRYRRTFALAAKF